MRRSAAIVLLLGLLLPAAGQSDPLQPGGFREFTPRGQASGTAREPRRYGQPAAAGQIPGGGQPRGNGYPPGQGVPPGYAPPGNPAPGQPGMQTPAGQPGALPAQGFLLDARNARAKKGRVPNGFGQLGLSEDQRERIYGIQSLYDGHIKRLEALIERLEAEEDVQYQYVLTEGQRRMYQRYLIEKGK